MNSTSEPAKSKSNKPNWYDKCMFRKLYYPEIVSVNDNIADIYKTMVYPNPNDNETVIELFADDETNLVSIDIYNIIGEKAGNVMSNKTFQRGKQKINVQTGFLPAEKYLVLIKNGLKTSVEYLNIVR